MTYARTAIRDFSTANKIYSGATVTFYEEDNGVKTAVKADLYSSLSGSSKVSNPQVLDAYGKFRQPVYIETSVIAEITGFGNAPDHETGTINREIIFSGTGSPEGVVAASVGCLYIRTDGGAGTTLYVKETGGTTSNGWSAK